MRFYRILLKITDRKMFKVDEHCLSLVEGKLMDCTLLIMSTKSKQVHRKRDGFLVTAHGMILWLLLTSGYFGVVTRDWAAPCHQPPMRHCGLCIRLKTRAKKVVRMDHLKTAKLAGRGKKKKKWSLQAKATTARDCRNAGAIKGFGLVHTPHDTWSEKELWGAWMIQ